MVQRPDLRPSASGQSGGSARPDLRPAALEKSFAEKTAGMSHDQIVEEYRKAKINSPYYKFLVKKIEAPQQGETPEQAAIRSGGQQPTGAPSKALSAFGGATDTLAFGGADELGAGLDWLRGGDYEQALAHHRAFRNELEEANPGSYLGGQLGGAAIQAAATLGASAPATSSGRLLMNMAGGASQMAGYNFLANDGDLGDRVNDAAYGAVVGGGLGIAPSVVEGVWKGGKALVNKGVTGVQKITNPMAAAEKDIVSLGAKDWRTHQRLARDAAATGDPIPEQRFLTQEGVDDAIAMGDNPMVADLGGDALRRRLKAADNVSDDASTLLRGRTDARATGYAARGLDTLSAAMGETNPARIRTRLEELSQKANEAAYGMVENHPNASHLWNGTLQRVLSTPEGERALAAAMAKSRRLALNSGQQVLEPIFERGQDGLMRFSGRFRYPNGQVATNIKNFGLNFRFWDSIKKSLDDEINVLQRQGYKEEARDIIQTKKQLLKNLDQQLSDGSGNSLYARARGTAKEFFDAEDAHEAGSKYYKNMNAFDTAEARAAIRSMSRPERELFARGYAAELMHDVSTLRKSQDVSDLFRDANSRMKMRDALGPQLSDQVEAIAHSRMVQGLLGKHLGANSTTVQQLLASEGLKMTATSAGGGIAGYTQTGSITGALMGMAIGGGFRASQRKVMERYARALAELATSNDPATIARISSKIAKESGYMNFSRAVANSASAANTAAIGTARAAAPASGGTPRLPFADGGRVPFGTGGEAIKKLLGYIVEDGVEKVAKKAPKAVDISDMPRIFDLSGLDAVPDVEQKMLPRYNPARGVSERTRDLISNPKVQRGVSETIERGVQMGGKRWYNNEPLRQRFVAELGPEEGERRFRQYMDYVAATSPRSKVPENARNASYYYSLAQDGAVPEIGSKNPQPYGHIAQRLHQMNAQRVFNGGWDALNNPKPSSFVENLVGNQMPGTIDTHATRLPAIISEDPRWLARQLVVKDPTTKEKLTLNPRKMFENGDITMEDALNRPAMWDAQPNDNEYAALEQMYANLAREQGLTTAQGQAAAWAGGADSTGLASVGADPFIKVFEDRVLMTAKQLGMDPQDVLSQMIHGKLPLLRDGGMVQSALATAA